MITDVFRGSVCVGIVDFESEVEGLTEVENNIEVVLPLGVQVVVDDLRVINFEPLGLVRLPLHLEHDHAVGLVPFLIQV